MTHTTRIRTWNSRIHRDRKLNGGGQGLGEEGECLVTEFQFDKMKSGRGITRLHLKHWTVHGNTVNTVDLLGGPYPPHRPRHSKFFSAHRPACSVCLHCRDTMKSLRQTYAHFQAAPLGSRPGKRVGVCVCLALQWV